MIGGVTIGSALLRAPSSIFKITAPKPIPTPIGVAHGLQIREIGVYSNVVAHGDFGLIKSRENLIIGMRDFEKMYCDNICRFSGCD